MHTSPVISELGRLDQVLSSDRFEDALHDWLRSPGDRDPLSILCLVEIARRGKLCTVTQPLGSDAQLIVLHNLVTQHTHQGLVDRQVKALPRAFSPVLSVV